MLERKTLTKEGYSAFEEIQDLEFGEFYGMNLDWGEKGGKVKRKEELAERKLRIAKTRLEAARSKEMGKNVERDWWIGWFVKELESQQTRVHDFKRLAHEARRDVESFDQWREAKRKEWEQKGRDDLTQRGHRLIEFETSSEEHRTQFDKRQELDARADEATMAHDCAELEVEFAKELVEAARTENVAQTIEQAALIRRTQKEVQYAEFHSTEEKESTKILDLKSLVLNDLYSITSLKRQLAQHKVLIDWVDQKSQELDIANANAGQRSGPRRSARISARAPYATEAFSINRLGNTRVRPPKSSTADGMSAHLGPLNSSRVSKTASKKPMGQQKAHIHRRTEKRPRGTSSASSRKRVKSSIDTSP